MEHKAMITNENGLDEQIFLACDEQQGYFWIGENSGQLALGGYRTEAEANQALHDAYRNWNLRWSEN